MHVSTNIHIMGREQSLAFPMSSAQCILMEGKSLLLETGMKRDLQGGKKFGWLIKNTLKSEKKGRLHETSLIEAGPAGARTSNPWQGE